MLNFRILFSLSLRFIQRCLSVGALLTSLVLSVLLGSTAPAQASSVSGSVSETVSETVSGNASPALDDASKTAMAQTQNLLKNQAEREKSMTSLDAKKTDQQVKDLMGSDTQGAYDLAAEIFPTLVNESGGDPIKMQATLSQMMKSPESLAAKLTPEQMTRLKELAKRVEARQPANNAH